MNHRDRRAGSPHRFVSRVKLREVSGKRAMGEQRLPELIEAVLVDSRYYLRHPYTQVLFPMTLRRGVTSMLRSDCSASVRLLCRNGRSSHEPCRLNARSLEPQWM